MQPLTFHPVQNQKLWMDAYLFLQECLFIYLQDLFMVIFKICFGLLKIFNKNVKTKILLLIYKNDSLGYNESVKFLFSYI